MERLTRLRAALALVALTALSLVALARVGLGLSELGAGGSRAVAAARLAPNGSDGALTVLVALLVASCFLAPAVPARRRLATWGVVLCAVSLVASVVALALSDLAVAGWSAVWLVPDLLVPAVVGVGLGALAAPTRAPTPDLGPSSDDAPVGQREPAPADPELEPSWPQDAASGAVWRTAGEAARGAPATGWGSGEVSSWSRPALPPGSTETARPGDPDRAPSVDQG